MLSDSSDVAKNWTSISANPSDSLVSLPPQQQNLHTHLDC